MNDVEPVRQARRDGIQVVERVAEILRQLSTQGDGLTPNELAERCGLPRPTVYRLARALGRENFVRWLPSGRIVVGPGLMGVAASSRRDIRHEVSPYLKRLSDELRETTDLAVLFAGEALYVDQYVAENPLRVVAHIGGTQPLHCTASGKALLASLDPETMESVLPPRLEALTANTITDKGRLREEIARVREIGLSFDLEENALGIVAVGAFVRDALDDVVSLAAVVPSVRYAMEKDAISAAVARTRDEAQAALLGASRKG